MTSGPLARFVVDEGGLQFSDESIEHVQGSMHELSEALTYARAANCGVLCWSQIWFVQSTGGRELSSWLFDKSDIDRDLRTLLGSQLSKLPIWDDGEVDVPVSFDCDGIVLEFAPSVGYACIRYVAGDALACLTTRSSPLVGERAIQSTDSSCALSARVWFLSSSRYAADFWRFAINIESMSAEEIAECADLAFPNLRFAEGLWRTTNRFEGSFGDVRRLLVQALAGLDDHAVRVWRDFPDNSRRQREMSALASVDCSPESPNTHRNRSAMNLREAVIDDETVVCEWHCKLEPHRNRVHFTVTPEQVLVGVFADHLPT